VIRFATRLGLVAIVCVALLGATSTVARAKQASCAVLEIHASKGKRHMAKNIPVRLARKLRRAPFTAWQSFTVVRAVSRPFAKPGAAQSIALERGSLALRRFPNANNQYKLQFVLKNRKGKRVLKTRVGVSPKRFFLVAGLPLRRGSRDAIQVIALSCQ